jgi:hypothetical protein
MSNNQNRDRPVIDWVAALTRKDSRMAALGRKGGLKGGKARAANRTQEELSAIGRMGAAARWGDKAEL